MKKSYLIVISLAIMACSQNPEPINYGADNCAFCKMTIIEQKFASEIVTKKGKVFKFDDLSCLVKYMDEALQSEADYAHVLVNEFEHPHEFIEISKAFFITSPKYQSPMMGNTASFSTEEKMKNLLQSDKDAKKYNWRSLINTLK